MRKLLRNRRAVNSDTALNNFIVRGSATYLLTPGRLFFQVEPTIFDLGPQSNSANTISKEEKKREAAAWHRNFVDLVAQWAAWFGKTPRTSGMCPTRV